MPKLCRTGKVGGLSIGQFTDNFSFESSKTFKCNQVGFLTITVDCLILIFFLVVFLIKLTLTFLGIFIFGLRPQTQPIYSFGIGVPKWPLFLWWFPISLHYKYALYCKCWEPPILTSGILTSDRGFPGNTLFHIFSLGFWLGINLFYLILYA